MLPSVRLWQYISLGILSGSFPRARLPVTRFHILVTFVDVESAAESIGHLMPVVSQPRQAFHEHVDLEDRTFISRFGLVSLTENS